MQKYDAMKWRHSRDPLPRRWLKYFLFLNFRRVHTDRYRCQNRQKWLAYDYEQHGVHTEPIAPLSLGTVAILSVSIPVGANGPLIFFLFTVRTLVPVSLSQTDGFDD